MRPVLPLVPLVCLLTFNLHVQEARGQRPPAAEPQPLPLLQGRPDAPADAGAGAGGDSGGVALGEPFESQGLGIALRPPAGSKVVRKVGGTEVEFQHEQNKWSLKVSRMELAEPMELRPGVDPQKNLPRAGLLEVTVDRLRAAMPGATILRSDVINVGPSDVGMVALRHVRGLETFLSQQAIFRRHEKLYYLLSMTSPGNKAAGKEAGDDPAERMAVETFQEVLDTVKLLDQRPLRQEQDERLFATMALYLNLGAEDRLAKALVPQQWFRLVRNGKDIGYVYTVEELADGIPGQRRNAAARGRGRGAAGGASGVLVGMRSRTFPGDDIRVDSESWMFCAFDRKTEQWSTLTVVQNLKSKAEDHLMTLGSTSRQAKRLLDKEAVARGEQWDKTDPGQPPVFTKEDYQLNVTHVSKTETAEPVSQSVSPWYLPHALAHLLPRVMPTREPKRFMFATYVDDARAVMARYVEVGREERVELAGEPMRAIPITDRIGLEGSVTTHYVTSKGRYVGSVNPDTGIVMLPAKEEELLAKWKDANLTRPADVKQQLAAPKAEAPRPAVPASPPGAVDPRGRPGR